MHHYHLRALGGYHHGNKHPDAHSADPAPAINAEKAIPSMAVASRHAHPTKTADMPTHSTTTPNPLPSTTETGASHSIPTALAKGAQNLLPKDKDHGNQAQAQTPAPDDSLSKPHSLGEKFRILTHKPAFFIFLIVVLVLISAMVLVIWKMRKRRQKRINGEKTTRMMAWHGDKGLV
ncbi:MAG: hypothetical protein Q9218_006593 [Villophora microphyllina]